MGMRQRSSAFRASRKRRRRCGRSCRRFRRMGARPPCLPHQRATTRTRIEPCPPPFTFHAFVVLVFLAVLNKMPRFLLGCVEPLRAPLLLLSFCAMFCACCLFCLFCLFVFGSFSSCPTRAPLVAFD